jgi:hypothetical protein
MDNEFEEILDAYVQMDRVLGEKGVMLKLKEREHRIQPITHTGFIWLDMRTANELGIVPADYRNWQDTDLNEKWLKKYLPGQKFRIMSRIETQVKKLEQHQISAILKRLDEKIKPFNADNKAKINHVAETYFKQYLERGNPEDIKFIINSISEGVREITYQYELKIIEHIVAIAKLKAERQQGIEPHKKTIETLKNEINDILVGIYRWIDETLAGETKINISAIRTFILQDFDRSKHDPVEYAPAVLNRQLVNEPEYNEKISMLFQIGYELHGVKKMPSVRVLKSKK